MVVGEWEFAFEFPCLERKVIKLRREKLERWLLEKWERSRPSPTEMKRRLKDFEERSDLSMNGLTKGLILICWQSQPNCWRRRDQLGAFVHSIGSSVYIYCTLTRSAASLFPFEKRRAWVMLDANWASAPFPCRGPCCTIAGTPDFFLRSQSSRHADKS